MCTYNISLEDTLLERVRPAFSSEAALQHWMTEMMKALLVSYGDSLSTPSISQSDDEMYDVINERLQHLEAGRYFEGRNDIEYGIEWSYTYNTDMNYSYFLKSQNGYMRVTKVSVNHYSVIAPVFTWPDNKDKENVMNDLSIQYSALKQLEKEGSLGKEDKQFMLQIENILTPYMSEVNAYRGKVFVEIDGERYYVKSFQK